MGGYDITYKKGKEAKKLIAKLKRLFLKKFSTNPSTEDILEFNEIWYSENRSIRVQFDLEKEEVYLTLNW